MQAMSYKQVAIAGSNQDFGDPGGCAGGESGDGNHVLSDEVRSRRVVASSENVKVHENRPRWLSAS